MTLERFETQRQELSTVQQRSASETFTASMFIESLDRYHEVLAIRREDINRINVFPVADQDTGSNLLHTMKALIPGLSPDVGLSRVAAAVADSAVFAGRGASGLILSQALAGMSRHLMGFESAGPNEMAGALSAASDMARSAVADPVEGTMITCARRAADAAMWCAERGSNLGGVTSTARTEAWTTVSETPTMLGVLANADVVDSGAVGYATLIDVLDAVVHGTDMGAVQFDSQVDPRGVAPDDRYELIVNLSQTDRPDELREGWSRLGSSVAIAQRGGEVRAHLHTNDLMSAYRAARRTGQPTRLEMTDLSVYTGDEANEITVVLASRIEEAEGLIALKPSRLLVPSDQASLTHIAETSRGHHLSVIVIGDCPPYVLELAAAAGSGVTLHEVADTTGARTYL